MVFLALEVRTATSGHLPPTHIRIHSTCSSTPLASTLRLAAISPTASCSAASPVLLTPFLPELSAASLFRLWCQAISTGSVVLSAIEVRTATSGHLRLPLTQVHGTWTLILLKSILRVAAISPTVYPSAASPSRALRSLPLSVMMSGYYDWHNGNSDWGTKNGRGVFWSSTPYSYTSSRDLYFYSTNVYFRSGNDKPHGYTLRCVARHAKYAIIIAMKQGKIIPNGVMLEEHEYKTILFFTELGFDIELIPKSNKKGIHTADIIMNNTKWELKSPKGKGRWLLENTLQKASKQSPNVIIDLARIKIHQTKCLQELEKQFHKSKKVKQLKIITKSRKMVEFKK